MPHLHREIENLKKMLLSLGAMVEENVRKAVRSFEKKDTELAATVIDSDPEIDRKEVDVEEECLKILALYQPVANDLRFIVAILKINNDLERIGDLAVNIAERAVYMAPHPVPDLHLDYRSMAKETIEMLKNSLDSLVNLDPVLAKQVCANDDIVDSMKTKMVKMVEEAIKEHPDQTEHLLQYLLVARHLERIADHTTNIAEDVIYMVKGNIVRHRMG